MASGTSMLLVYIVGWGLVFGTFVHYYHKRKARALAKLEAWYPSHPERDIYYSLAELKKTHAEAVPQETLRAALFRRAMADIMRAIELKMNKQTLTNLVKSGAMSEELLHQFNAAEVENEGEMMSVVQEAEKMQKGWGGSIFYAASEMVNNHRLRELREEMLKLNFESAKCNRDLMMEAMSPEEREKATTDGTPENKELMKNDVILSSIFNMPIGQAMKIAAAAHAKRQQEAQAKAAEKPEVEEKPKIEEKPEKTADKPEETIEEKAEEKPKDKTEENAEEKTEAKSNNNNNSPNPGKAGGKGGKGKGRNK
ncbi:translocation protein Sec66 [Coemansia sp. RSA 1813]|nr:Translocation protein S66 [Coemansia sp. RSA 1646]KAJ1772352.1 translocation protein Sec66 [Coemansia sp. RSA 1843]KAJ2093290.1 translocation protein Sec66 [Coemansia sp. RSA 986]KAJ2213021.1 translocation protein Sec66 [Coemansia sp. RSA 487]KAJ2573544.1 translocation protein Sec66 [Coemansia sp. RSA 1813]